MRSGPRLVLPSATYVAALVALSAGVGLAVPRLGKDDVGPVAWLGLAVLDLGVAGAGWAVWRLLRGVRRRWWLVTLPALLVVAYLAL